MLDLCSGQLPLFYSYLTTFLLSYSPCLPRAASPVRYSYTIITDGSLAKVSLSGRTRGMPYDTLVRFNSAFWPQKMVNQQTMRFKNTIQEHPILLLYGRINHKKIDSVNWLQTRPRSYASGTHPSVFYQNPQHSPQWLGCTPEQLIADGKSGEIFTAHIHLSQPSDRHHQLTSNSTGCQFF